MCDRERESERASVCVCECDYTYLKSYIFHFALSTVCDEVGGEGVRFDIPPEVDAATL